MKFFSIFSIAAATLLLGYFVIVGLPSIAKINKGTDNQVVTKMTHTELLEKENLILRDKCNTYVASAIFASGSEADAFLDSCMNGNETSKINVIRGESKESSSTSTTQSEPRLTAEELSIKCNDFMSHAKFETQKDADNFLKNCLAGN